MLGVDAKVMDADDMRVGKLAGDARLTLEAGIELRLGAQVWVDELYRDIALEGQVHRPVDLGHAAAAAHLEQPIAIADHHGQLDVAAGGPAGTRRGERRSR